MTKNEYMIELLRARRSTRKFKSTPIEKEKIDILKEAALRSPTSRNLEPWHFVFLTREDTRRKLAQVKPHGAAFIAEAPLAVLVCADRSKSDVWIEDCSIASIVLQMTAQSMGLGSCWVQVRKRSFDEDTTSEAYIKSVFDLSEFCAVESIIAIGYPAEFHEPIPYDDLDQEKIHDVQ
jgi:nitroreductase